MKNMPVKGRQQKVNYLENKVYGIYARLKYHGMRILGGCRCMS
jgi:hypothetical protein